MFQDLETFGGGGWMAGGFPSLDVRESNGEIRVEAELPGVEAADLDVKLDGRTLTIQGEKKITRESEEGAPHRIERFFGSFRRDVPLPADVDADSCDAAFRDGVLQVKMKKSPGSEARDVEIES